VEEKLITEAARELILRSIGLGLVLSLAFSETLGLAAGGMVVPGYVALMLHHPLRIVGTILVSLATFLTMKFLSNYLFIYGRRRTVAVILIGFAFGWLSRQLLVIKSTDMTIELETIGFIIPGLIANWMERQGVVETISVMTIAAILVRMLLMILSNGQITLGSDVTL
jgi:poly-gamma-glutamate biosynthesis protein PgsC/CapC